VSARRTPRPKKHTPKKLLAKKPAAPKVDHSARNQRIAIVAAVVVAIAIVAFFPVALATDQPSFCPACHTMQPFYSAWQTGPHKDVWCIDCHVEPGYPARALHKFAALQEVYDQFFTTARFPKYNAEIPDSRCLRCHPDVPTKAPAAGQFSHQMHLATNVKCTTCHASTGHKVTFAALDSAGLLDPNMVTAGTTVVGEQLSTSGARSVLSGHKPVPCSNCHDMASQQCSFCHTPPANHFGADCKLCHKPGVAFADFTHPPSGEHKYTSRPCAKCHPNGYATVFCTCHNGNPPKGD
jgi:cytochrome c nitrite reductase small subunit